MLHFIKASAWDNKRNGLEIQGVVRQSCLLHSKSEDPWLIVEALYVLGRKVFGKLLDFQFQVRSVLGESLVIVKHLWLLGGDVDPRVLIRGSILGIGTDDLESVIVQSPCQIIPKGGSDHSR
jgi:hypothetical protein